MIQSKGRHVFTMLLTCLYCQSMASLRNAIKIISNSTFPSGRECCLGHCLLFLPHVLLGRLKKRPQILNNCLTSFHLSLVTMQLRVRVVSFSRNHRRFWVHICVCAFTTLAVVCAPPYSFILTNSLWTLRFASRCKSFMEQRGQLQNILVPDE